MDSKDDGKQEWSHPNTATIVGYMLKMEWKTPFLGRLRSINTQWKMAIDSMDINFFDFSSCCQGEVQPRNSHRLRFFRNGHLIHHNLQAYGKHSRGARTVIARTVICFNQEMYPPKALATGLKTCDQSMPCSPWLRDTRSCGKRV